MYLYEICGFMDCYAGLKSGLLPTFQEFLWVACYRLNDRRSSLVIQPMKKEPVLVPKMSPTNHFPNLRIIA
jgi:hypothetical protein